MAGPLTLTQRRNIKRWIEALRSGHYEQAQGALLRIIGDKKLYCCLGVLCTLKQVKKQVDTSGTAYRFMFDPNRFSGSTVTVPDQKFNDWCGLDYTAEEQRDILFRDELINFNDAEGGDGHKSFKGIAQVIERRANKVHPGWQEGL